MNPHNSKPVVSIIVPSFNQGRFIRETIDSILDQEYRPIEVLVMDGASTDETVDVLESFGEIPELNYWSAADSGVVDAVNKGFARARGSVIGIQSSDDLYLPGAIATAVDFLMENGDITLVYGDVEYIDEHSQVIGSAVLDPFDLNDYLGRFTYIPQPSAFFRASALAGLGGWREEVSYAADADFWIRMAVRGKAAHIPRTMARYRRHPEQRDAQKAKISRDWEETIRDLLRSNCLDKPGRSFARMGIHLARYKYTNESSWVRRTLHLYHAALANPWAVLHPLFPKEELLPGRTPIWKVLSRIKREMGFAPRVSKAGCKDVER